MERGFGVPIAVFPYMGTCVLHGELLLSIRLGRQGYLIRVLPHVPYPKPPWEHSISRQISFVGTHDIRHPIRNLLLGRRDTVTSTVLHDWNVGTYCCVISFELCFLTISRRSRRVKREVQIYLLTYGIQEGN